MPNRELSLLTAPAVNQAPTLQLIKPTYDRSTRHVHIGSNLGNRKRLTVQITNRHAYSNEERFYARAEGLADWRVSTMHSSHAAHYGLPAIYGRRDFVLAGGLISYGDNVAESYRQI